MRNNRRTRYHTKQFDKKVTIRASAGRWLKQHTDLECGMSPKSNGDWRDGKGDMPQFFTTTAFLRHPGVLWLDCTSLKLGLFSGVYCNQDLIWCVKIRVYNIYIWIFATIVGSDYHVFWVHRGF